MKESGYYPIGAEYDDNAPYNEEISKPQQVEVTVSITLSKTMTIDVRDFKSEYDEETQEVNYDFSDSDLKGAVQSQCILPHEAYKYIGESILKEDMKDWVLDDLEVIEE